MASHEPVVAAALLSDASLSHQRVRVLVGPRDAVRAGRRALSTRGALVRLTRDQLVYSVWPETLLRFSEPELRLAEAADTNELLKATIGLHVHETLEVPTPREIPLFRRGIEFQIADGRLHVLTAGSSGQLRRSLRFKAAVSAKCRDGAQIEGVFVPQEERGCGYARRSLSQLCQLLFEEVGVISLTVNADNIAAINLYERSLGFRPVADFRTVFFFG